jgi:hypothetical protein
MRWKYYLTIMVIAAATMAVVFRVPQVKTAVLGS